VPGAKDLVRMTAEQQRKEAAREIRGQGFCQPHVQTDTTDVGVSAAKPSRIVGPFFKRLVTRDGLR